MATPLIKNEMGTRVADQEAVSMEPVNFTKYDAIALYWKIAMTPPEETRGSIRGQIHACRNMYRDLGHDPALKILSELANIDAARTKGHRRGQEAAAKLLKRLVSSIKVDKNLGIQ
jgi:hypothetical protein